MASPIELLQKTPRRKAPRTKHPCAGMTASQRRAFEAIATGTHSSLLPKKSLDALVARGLLVHVKHHEIPLWAHQQWCAWRAERSVEEDSQSK